jgi:hypothetical protein
LDTELLEAGLVFVRKYGYETLEMLLIDMVTHSVEPGIFTFGLYAVTNVTISSSLRFNQEPDKQKFRLSPLVPESQRRFEFIYTRLAVHMQ